MSWSIGKTGRITIVILLFVTVTIYTIRDTWRDRDTAVRLAHETEATLEELKQDKETLDLALEFGFDPMIVRITQQLSKQAMRTHKCKDCQTWRWIDNDKKLTYILLSVIQTESRGDTQATSSTGAQGLTQLFYSTARDYDKNLQKQELYEIPTNLRIAMRHFVSLLDKFHGNTTLAVLAWNQGGGGVDRLIALGNSPENGFARKVFEQAAFRNAGGME